MASYHYSSQIWKVNTRSTKIFPSQRRKQKRSISIKVWEGKHPDDDSGAFVAHRKALWNTFPRRHYNNQNVVELKHCTTKKGRRGEKTVLPVQGWMRSFQPILSIHQRKAKPLITVCLVLLSYQLCSLESTFSCLQIQISKKKKSYCLKICRTDLQICL